MSIRRTLILLPLAVASLAFATPEARVGNVRVASDLVVVVMPGGVLNPHLKTAVTAAAVQKPMVVRIGEAEKTSRHTAEQPDRTVLIEVEVDGRTTQFAQFPFPLAMERGEVYNVPLVERDFGYSLYLALRLAADADPLLVDAAAIDRRVAVLTEQVAGLRRSLPELPGVLQFTLPPFLVAAEEKIRAASADCADALVGKPASVASRAVRLLVAEQFLREVVSQVARW